MPNDAFCLCLRALAVFCDSGRHANEESLDRLEQSVLALPAPKRNEVRRQMILVIAHLSRLELRLSEHDGANETVV